MLKVKKKGLLVVISSPSGAGKTTITKKLVSQNRNMELSVSLTTRNPRKNEKHNIDYKFVNKKIFNKYIKKNFFLEYAKVFDNYYGTLKSKISNKIKKKKIILLDIDWQGARQIRQKKINNIVTIFILPPSINILKKRLRKRENDINFINKRMARAKKEIMHWKEYDYVVVNKSLTKCVNEIKNIIYTFQKKPLNFYI